MLNNFSIFFIVIRTMFLNVLSIKIKSAFSGCIEINDSVVPFYG